MPQEPHPQLDLPTPVARTPGPPDTYIPYKYQRPPTTSFEEPCKPTFLSGDEAISESLRDPCRAVRVALFTMLAGFLGFLAVQICLVVCNTLSSVSVGVSAVATGASYVGVWALFLQAGALLHRLLPFAATLYGLVAPQPAIAGPEPLPLAFIVENFDARHFSAVACSLVSLLGCLFGKPS